MMKDSNEKRSMETQWKKSNDLSFCILFLFMNLSSFLKLLFLFFAIYRK